MPIALEFINILVRKDAIDAKYPGGWNAFLESTLHNPAIGWYDNYIYRTGTMSGHDAEDLVEKFEKAGFTTYRKRADGLDEWVDLCVWDSFFGPTAECNWIDFSYHREHSRIVRFQGDRSTKIADRDHLDATSTTASTLAQRLLPSFVVNAFNQFRSKKDRANQDLT
jgi:hypothetical protein